MPELPGHERREARRERRRERRLVRAGDFYTADEEEAGDVELEEVESATEPDSGEAVEPWAFDGSKEVPELLKQKLQMYLEGLRVERMEAGSGD